MHNSLVLSFEPAWLVWWVIFSLFLSFIHFTHTHIQATVAYVVSNVDREMCRTEFHVGMVCMYKLGVSVVFGVMGMWPACVVV